MTVNVANKRAQSQRHDLCENRSKCNYKQQRYSTLSSIRACASLKTGRSKVERRICYANEGEVKRKGRKEPMSRCGESAPQEKGIPVSESNRGPSCYKTEINPIAVSLHSEWSEFVGVYVTGASFQF